MSDKLDEPLSHSILANSRSYVARVRGSVGRIAELWVTLFAYVAEDGSIDPQKFQFYNVLVTVVRKSKGTDGDRNRKFEKMVY